MEFQKFRKPQLIKYSCVESPCISMIFTEILFSGSLSSHNCIFTPIPLDFYGFPFRERGQIKLFTNSLKENTCSGAKPFQYIAKISVCWRKGSEQPLTKPLLVCVDKTRCVFKSIALSCLIFKELFLLKQWNCF